MAEPIELTGTYTDQANKKATNTLYLAAGLTIAQFTEGIQALSSLIDAVLGAIINGLQFTVAIDLSGLTSNEASTTSDVEEVGEFIFTTGQNRPVIVNLPGILDTFSPAGSDNLDLADSDIAAFVTAIEDGIVVTGGTIIPCDVDQNDITELVTARERVRNTGTRS